MSSFYQREIGPNGRTRVLRATATIELRYCGGTYVEIPTVNPITGVGVTVVGWQGGGYLHRYDPTRFQYHSVSARCGFGPPVTIVSRQGTDSAFRPPDETPLPAYVTQVLFGTEVIAEWADPSDPDLPDYPGMRTPAETIIAQITWTVTAQEWLFESYGSLRPQHPSTPVRGIYLKPIGDVTTSIVCTGGGAIRTSTPVTSFIPPRTGMLPESSHGYSTYVDEPFVTDPPEPSDEGSYGSLNVGTECYHFWDADGYHDLPWPNATFATAYGLDPADHHLVWSGDTGLGPVNGISGASFAFYSPRAIPSTAFAGLSSIPDYSSSLALNLKDWPNGGIGTARFVHNATGTPQTFTLSGSGSVGTNAPAPGDWQIEYAWLDTNGYDPLDRTTAWLREGTSWAALSISHDPELVVDTFTRTYPSGHDWTGDNATLSVDGSDRVATSTGSAPGMARDFRSDYSDLVASSASNPDPPYRPDSWVDAYGPSGTNEIPSSFVSWYNGEAGGPTLFKNGPGEWFRVGKKLRPDSDICNWTAYRYLYLTAKADATCDLTMTLHYQDTNYVGGTMILSDFVGEFTVPLTTSFAEQEIDLGVIDQIRGAKNVVRVEFTWPDGRTLTFRSLKLRRKGAAKIIVHIPKMSDSGDRGDYGMLTALVDGVHGLYFTSFYNDTAPSTSYNSTWGWPVKQRYTGDIYGSSLLMTQLAQEISLQEGWSATVVGAPDESFTPNCAVYLLDNDGADCPCTLRARRAYGGVKDILRPGRFYTIEDHLGTGVFGITFDVDTKKAISTRIQSEDIENVALDTAISRPDGTFELQSKAYPSIDFVTAPGTPAAYRWPPKQFYAPLDEMVRVTLGQHHDIPQFLTVLGHPSDDEPDVGGGWPYLVTDSDGNRHIVYIG